MSFVYGFWDSQLPSDCTFKGSFKHDSCSGIPTDIVLCNHSNYEDSVFCVPYENEEWMYEIEILHENRFWKNIQEANAAFITRIEKNEKDENTFYVFTNKDFISEALCIEASEYDIYISKFKFHN